MTRRLPPLITKSLFKANWQYALIGIVAGLALSMLHIVFTGKIPPLKNLLFYVSFSFFISVSIANSLYLFEHYIKPRNIKNWQLIAIYYLCNLVGMLIGTELSYMVLSFSFGIPNHFLQHYSDYKYSPIIVIIAGTLIYLYQNQRTAMLISLQEKELDLAKLKQLKTNAELQALQAKINPHFLYNALNTIASLTSTNPSKSEEMTLQLSKLFRYSLGSQQNNFVTIAEEMEIVDTYLSIEKVRFGDRISFDMVTDDNCKTLLIPRFLLQPLVENAVKHGLKNVLEEGKLCLELLVHNAEIIIKIADNGMPFPEMLEIGYGLQSTYDKLNLLYGDKYQLQLINSPSKHILIQIPAKPEITII